MIKSEVHDKLLGYCLSSYFDFFKDFQNKLELISIFTGKELEARDYEFMSLIMSLMTLSHTGVKFNTALPNVKACEEEFMQLAKLLETIKIHLDAIYSASGDEVTAQA